MWKINKSEALAGNKEATEWDRTESKAARDEKCVKIYDQMWHEAIRVCARSVLAAAINLTREAFRRGLESWEENFRKFHFQPDRDARLFDSLSMPAIKNVFLI